MTGEWLDLLNYSTKHNISLSTLRRRIKGNSIKFKLEHGKYYILDEAPGKDVTRHYTAQVAPAPQAQPQFQMPQPQYQQPPAPQPMMQQQPVMQQPVMQQAPMATTSAPAFVEASVLSSANRLVEEIKAAYAKILQEKEEQISQLKEQVVDLKMLCRILEDTNKKPSPTRASEGSSSSDDFIFSDFQSRDL